LRGVEVEKRRWRRIGAQEEWTSVSVCPTSASLSQADPATCPFLSRLSPHHPSPSFLPQHPHIPHPPPTFPSFIYPPCPHVAAKGLCSLSLPMLCFKLLPLIHQDMSFTSNKPEKYSSLMSMSLVHSLPSLLGLRKYPLS
jgi:hypothetical protein